MFLILLLCAVYYVMCWVRGLVYQGRDFDPRGGPHRSQEVALTTCSIWHLAPHIVCVPSNRSIEDAVVDPRGGPHESQEVAPACMWHGTLLHVALSFIHRSYFSGMVLGFGECQRC